MKTGLLRMLSRNPPRDPYRCSASRAFRKSLSRMCSSCSSARACRISFSRLFSFLGTTTRTCTTRLPGSPPPLARGAPAPRTLSRLPSCVPAGNLSFTVPPPGRGTSISAPRAASTKLTGTSTRKSSPRRSKTGCSATRVTTYRFPGGPPFFPALPLSGTRIFIPSLAPAGIFTVTGLFLRNRPLPEHPEHRFSTIVPSPPHRPHGCDKAKKPCSRLLIPRPERSGHIRRAVPGAAPVPRHLLHSSSTGAATRVVTPSSASLNLRFTLTVTSSPRVVARSLLAPPKISPKLPNRSDRSEKLVSYLPVVPPRGVPPKYARGPSSYSRLFSGLERTS